MKTALSIIFLALSVSSLIWLIVTKCTKVGMPFFWTKLIASVAFVVSGFVAVMLKSTIELYVFFVLIGLVMGKLGDILLALKEIYKPHEGQYLNGGFLCFAIGHIMYIIGFSLYATKKAEILVPMFVGLAIGAVLATLICVNAGKLGIDFGRFKPQCYAYSFVLCITTTLMFALAIMVSKLWIVAAALLLFLISDLVLSLIYFAPRKDTNVNWGLNLGTYYVAQILIVAFLMFV